MNPALARKYGLHEALMIEVLAGQFRCNHDQWIALSARKISNALPFWTAKQVRRVLLSLESQGVLRSRVLNADPNNRTKAYTFTPEEAQ